jgi:predicted ABC-type ATPase
MPAPEMLIVAGPPGAGKSTVFALSDYAENIFGSPQELVRTSIYAAF